MKFRSQYDPEVRIKQPAGNDEITEYMYSEDDNRAPYLAIIGKHSQREYIQSFKDSADIYKILEACGMSNDPSMLRAYQTFAMDLTQIPEDYHQLNELKDEFFAFYDALPQSIKDKYPNPAAIADDPNFMAQAAEILKPAPEVKADET